MHEIPCMTALHLICWQVGQGAALREREFFQKKQKKKLEKIINFL